MQIPIRDIIRIYESEDMSIVVEAFVNRINAIDDEVNALSELKCNGERLFTNHDSKRHYKNICPAAALRRNGQATGCAGGTRTRWCVAILGEK